MIATTLTDMLSMKLLLWMIVVGLMCWVADDPGEYKRPATIGATFGPTHRVTHSEEWMLLVGLRAD